MNTRRVSFGWGAPSIAQQFPEIAPEDARRFDKCSHAMTLLSIHGALTESERNRVCIRLTKMVGKALGDTK